MWTLWGMGLSALSALLATLLAYAAQSPQFLARAGLSGYRLDLRVRTFTGIALAAMLLAGGFFLAGVPLETLATPTPITAVSPPIPSTSAVADSAEAAVPTRSNSSRTPQSGAFAGPPPTATTETGEETAVSPSPDDSSTVEATSAPPFTATPSPPPTIPPTSTPTPSPTITPTPTLTPTPIEGETAVINTGSSTLWVRRSPGSQTLILVRGGDIVILMPGHAHQGGILWQEVMTLDGAVGWVQEMYLTKDEG